MNAARCYFSLKYREGIADISHGARRETFDAISEWSLGSDPACLFEARIFNICEVYADAINSNQKGKQAMNTAQKLPLTIDENVDAQISELDELFALHKFNKSIGLLQQTFTKRIKSGGPAAGHAFALKMANLSKM